MSTLRQRRYYALIDNGEFSGKPAFVYNICTSLKKAIELEKKEGHKRVKITKEEYEYIKKQDESIDVLYLEECEPRFTY